VVSFFLYFFPAFKPIHCAGWVISFYLPFIDVGLFKDRAVAMGKPHCNRSIRTFLVIAPAAFVNLAWDFILVLTSVYLLLLFP